MEEKTIRRTASPLHLLRQAAGDSQAMAQKLRRMAGTLGSYGDQAELRRRIDRLVRAGVIDEAPTDVQLFAGAVDMLRFWISPAAAEYYASVGIGYGFHQVLRFLDDPASIMDPLGFFSSRDVIIGHVLQVVHANPKYDLELLEMFDDGVEQLEKQTEMMLDGTHPRFASISAVVEEPDYHARLLEYVRAFRKNPNSTAPIRANVASNPHWVEIERTFGSLRTSMHYFCRLPRDLPSAMHHLATVKTFPSQWAEPAS